MDPEDTVLRSTSVQKRLLGKTYSEALTENEKSIIQWEEYKEDHEALIKNLMLFRDKLSLDIMIPLGTKAFVCGKLRNTNEILVSLGDSWFTKKSSNSAAELCTRRINYCNEVLEKLKKEQKLLESRKTFPLENEMFGDERFPEIIEPYNEQAEKEWRIRHRENVSAYHKRLAELKKSTVSKMETEEDIWTRLDALDQQEELEEELDRLNEDEEDIISSDDVSETDDENHVITHINSDQSKSCSRGNNESCRVSFNNQDEIMHFKDSESLVYVTNEEQNDIVECSGPIIITFLHSPLKVEITENLSDEIVSPADIYKKFSCLSNETPKSILKKSSKDYSCSKTEKDVIENDKTMNKTRPEIQAVIVPVGEVVEHKDCVEQPIKSRPVSKFKAARMAAKR